MGSLEDLFFLPLQFPTTTITGVNATCVGIPDFVKDKIIPLKCVQCENNLWSFKGDLNLMSLGKCLRNGGDTITINIFGLIASILVSLLIYRC